MKVLDKYCRLLLENPLSRTPNLALRTLEHKTRKVPTKIQSTSNQIFAYRFNQAQSGENWFPCPHEEVLANTSSQGRKKLNLRPSQLSLPDLVMIQRPTHWQPTVKKVNVWCESSPLHWWIICCRSCCWHGDMLVSLVVFVGWEWISFYS